MSDAERITELEIRIAHLEAALGAMSDELALQQKLSGSLRDELGILRERMATMAEATPEGEEPPPPHY